MDNDRGEILSDAVGLVAWVIGGAILGLVRFFGSLLG